MIIYKGCSTPFCSCRSIETNDDFIACEKYVQEIYLQCINDCSHDDHLCPSSCNREYTANLKECPCQENCPNGCPCPNYSCQAATTTTKVETTTTPVVQNKTVLVLHSSYNGSWKPALLIDSSGRQDELGCFSHDDNSQAHWSCSLNWENEFYIFGGKRYPRQISKLNQYRLQALGDLPFDFEFGACTNFNSHKFFLCFDWHNNKRCYWSTDPLGSFTNVTLSSYSHDQIRISSSECKF